MGWLIITLASFTALVLAMEAVCWILFRRKMEPMNFPSHPDGSHTHYLRRLRIFAIAHTASLCAFVWIFCIALWW